MEKSNIKTLFGKGKPLSMRPTIITGELFKSITDSLPLINDNAQTLDYIVEVAAIALQSEGKLTTRGQEMLSILQDYKKLNERAPNILDV